MRARENPPAQKKVGQDQLVVQNETESFEVMGVQIAATSMPKAIRTLESWVETGTTPRLVTFTTVHILTEGHRNPVFLKMLRQMDMNCPDGMPLVWLGRLKKRSVSKVPGPDFMPAFCAHTASKGFRHFFYGGNVGVAEAVVTELKRTIPDLEIAGWFTPPFGTMGREADETVVRLINDSRADILWVCLGCPKQEIWMAEHRERLNARLILSVGMAFDIVAGRKERAPAFLRNCGMEWLFRMITEPRRLAGRYLYSNSAFIYGLVRDSVTAKKSILARDDRMT
jgi:N-acetylglucosaminyldiphosphoundecaprenol N-acetyl-beta-D-mannosaminyltransferase